MIAQGLVPNDVTYIALLSGIAQSRNIELGKQIHQHMIDNHVSPSAKVQCQLMDMYASCHDHASVMKIFQNLKQSNQLDNVAWNTIIKASVHNHKPQLALNYFHSMIEEGFTPDEVTYVSILSGVVLLKDIKLGKKIHQQMIDNRISLNSRVQCQLMDMYGSCNDLPSMLETFENLKQSKQLNTVSWNIIIKALIQNNQPQKAIDYFRSMIDQQFIPDEATFITLLPGISKLKDIELGKKIHQQILNLTLFTPTIQCLLMEMYGLCNDLLEPLKIFENLKLSKQLSAVSWTPVVQHIIQSNQSHKDIDYFRSVIEQQSQTNSQEVGNEIHPATDPRNPLYIKELFNMIDVLSTKNT
jgi:pentatricopeptide repeat protein